MPSSSRWRWPLRAALALALLGAGLIAILAWVDLGPLLRRQLMSRLPALEADLGLRFHLGPVHLRAWSSLRLELHDLALRPAEDADPKTPPLLSARTLRVNLALFPLLRSGHLHIHEISVEAPVLRLVRRPDGRWAGADALARLQARQTPQKTPSAAQIEALQHLVLSRATLRDGEILVHDLPIRKIRLSTQEVRPDQPLTIEAGAALGAVQEDVSLSLGLGPLFVSSTDGSLSAPPQTLALRLKDLQIAPLLALLLGQKSQVGQVSLAQARLSGELAVRAPAGLMQVEIAGSLDAQGMTLRDGPSSGHPTDARLRLQADLMPLPGSAQIKTLSLSLGEMGLSGSLALRQLWLGPQLDDLSLRSSGVTMERVLALLPPSQIPSGAILRGPVSLSLSASGTKDAPSLVGSLDLSQATLRTKDLNKPAGVPLSAQLRAHLRRGAVEVERLGVALGPVALWLRGTVRGPRDLDLRVENARIELSPLRHLLPALARVPSALPLGETAQLSGSLRRDGDVWSGALHATVSGPQATLRTAHLDASLRNGVLIAREVRLQALSGTIDASGSSADLSRSPPRLHLRVRAEHLDLAPLGALRGEWQERQLSGLASLEADVEGAALPWPALGAHLEGPVALRLTDAHILAGSVHATIVNPMLAKVAARAATQEAAARKPRTELRALSLRGRLGQGRLHLQGEGLRLTTSEGEGAFQGSIGLERSLDLSGSFFLTPQAVEVATEGRLSPRGTVPVGLRLRGTYPTPQVELLELRRTAAALLGAFLRGR